MSRASSRKLTTAQASQIYAKHRRKLRRTISNRTVIAATSFLSKKYGLLPCFCDHNPLRMIKRCQASTLSKSSNAFWHRTTKSKDKLVSKKQQRNNSTTTETRQTSATRANNFKTFRTSIVQRFKRNKKKKLPTITARSVIRKSINKNIIKHGNSTDQPSVDRSTHTMQLSLDQPLSTQYGSEHSFYDSDRLASQDNSYDNDEENTLEPTISSFKPEQQNINATNNISQTIQETSQTNMNNLDSSKKTKVSRKNPSNGTRNASSRSTISSSKRKKSSKQKRTSKPKLALSNKSIISASKRKNSKVSFGRSPFPDPTIFHTIPPMQNSDEITKNNVHKNHLCCKPITSVKNLSTSDQKKLIEHDCLTFISLLPIYLGSQDNFQEKIREKTNISHDGALELDRLMNEWSSARLFIGANSHYKTLTQII